MTIRMNRRVSGACMIPYPSQCCACYSLYGWHQDDAIHGRHGETARWLASVHTRKDVRLCKRQYRESGYIAFYVKYERIIQA